MIKSGLKLASFTAVGSVSLLCGAVVFLCVVWPVIS